MMVKGILFLVAAALIVRTGTRLLTELGGLAGVMPVTFGAAAIAIVAMSGLPPLTGFGGKWLLLSAMMEKGWYGPVVLTLLATFLGFLYMTRFIQVIFLGPRKPVHESVPEAPIALLVVQYLLIAGILVMSFLPKLLIEPISRAIDPTFASTLRWQGMSLELIYGNWNPVPVMASAVAAAAILFAALWLLQRACASKRSGVHSRSGNGAWFARFNEFYMPVVTALTPPWASAFWGAIPAAVTSLAERTRLLYTGNGQTYNLYILYYFLALYAAGGGLRYLWPRLG
jgi:NADH:ubiquinone oxidoreductase subunit 5 (subunit L)/multisubunit Na+/H+ antiporter MnhA subunit